MTPPAEGERARAREIVEHWAPEWDFELHIAARRSAGQPNPKDALINDIAAALRAPQPSAADEIRGCPCLHVTPCHYACTCAQPFMSGGCRRCAAYGSVEQQRAAAEHLAGLIDAAPASPEAVARVDHMTWAESLRKYGRHFETCPGNHPAYCDCGLTALLARLTPPTGAQAPEETRMGEERQS